MAGVESIRGVVGFVRTVAAGSFSGAAKALGVSAVAVSKNVQRLERQLGVRLLQRSTRKLSLTQEGRLFYERCTGPLQELESAQTAVRDRGGSAAGTLRVTALPSFARAYVLPLLPAFSSLYPRIEVELHLDDSISDMIAEGYDVGIRAGEMREGTMVVREIAPLYFVVCGAPGYFSEHGVPATPAELAGHNCLRLRGRGTRPDRPLNWMLGPQRAAVDPPVRGNLIANDITTLVAAAVHGHGLVLAPLPFVLPLFRAGSLVPVLAQWISRRGQLFVHYPNRRQLPARVRSFVNFLLEQLRRNPDLGTDAQALVAPYAIKAAAARRASRERANA
jgi:LysR family transcriptional regulator, transcriptional activator for dmlA